MSIDHCIRLLSSSQNPPRRQYKHVRSSNLCNFELGAQLTSSVIPVMICRLVLSLRKATDPNLVRAWNVDHFSQVETQLHRGQETTLLSPLRFYHPTVTVASLGRGMESEDGFMTPGISRPLADSGWTIDGPDDEDRIEHNHRTP